MKKYSITTYQSGTTWIHHQDYECGLHIGYFTMEKADHELKLKGRGSQEKARFASALCRLLNEAAEYFQTGNSTYFCSLYCPTADIQETMIVFKDCLLGNMDVNCFTVGEMTSWKPTQIPEEILRDLKYGLQRIIECDEA